MSNKPNTTNPNERTITLKTPWTQGEQTITELVIRKPMARDLSGVKLLDFVMGDADAYALVLPRLITNVAIHPDTITEQLDFIDLLDIQVQVADFLPTSKAPTVSKSSLATSP